MPETREKCLSLVISRVDYARQTRQIYFVYCLTEWIPKISGSLEIHGARQYSVDVVLFRIKD